VGLNAGFVVTELTAGLMTGSLALIADAAHNLTDVAGLLVAWGATVLANRPPSSRFTCWFGPPGGHPGDGFLAQIADDLAHEFSIPRHAASRDN
jgi:hypothetical protein